MIDPVLDYNRNNARTSWTSDEKIAAYLDREGRDTELEAPELILPSIQVNIRAGALPEAEAYGTGYLKIPLNVLGKAE
ncbi:MAG: hypothetical protein ABGX04_06280 [Myxococcales bacterium]